MRDDIINIYVITVVRRFCPGFCLEREKSFINRI